MKRPRLNPRKLLIASAGVATVNYAFAAGCGGTASESNQMAPATGGSNSSGGSTGSGGSGSGGTGASSTGLGGSRGMVANLVAPPPPVFSGPVANLMAPPPVLGPPSPVPTEALDAAVPDAAASDAALDGG